MRVPERPDARPLTEAQEGLWFFQALDPANPILNTGQYLELTGPLDRAALAQAVDLTLAEAEALRLRFGTGDAGPVQWLDPAPLRLEIRDCDADAALEVMRQDSARALDLAGEPLARFILFRLSEQRHFLYERIHHLAIDGYGMVLVSNRFAEHYAALTTGAAVAPAFPPLERAFELDAAYRAAPARETDAGWWREEMRQLPEVQGPVPGRAVSGRAFLRHGLAVPADLLAALQDFATGARLQWPDVLTGLTGAYLARWTGGEEAVIGTPYMARMGRPIARVPCMAMNVLPQRIRPDEEAPLAEWLADLARQMRAARSHGHYRSEQLRRDLGLVGGARRLIGPLVNVQPFDRPPVFAGLDTRLHILGAGAVDDLTFTFRGDPRAGMLFELDANPELYTLPEVQAHAGRLLAFLQGALAAGRLADVPTATPEEIARQEGWNATAHPVPDTTLVDLIRAQIARTPDAPAVTFGDQTLDFAGLDRASAALSEYLLTLGAGPERIVAVAMDRSLELPVALLAILRAGAAYLPLDPDHPPERLAAILAQAAPVAVLTQPHLADRLPAGLPVLTPADWPAAAQGQIPENAPEPGDMAYVIFTSGSTGAPKGVVVEHRAIVNRLLWMAAHYGIGPQDRILQKTPATFDVSVWEFFLPMLTGAELVMAPPGAHRDPFALARLIRDHRITTAHFVPSMLSAFLAAPESQGLSLSRVFCSGEELTPDQRDRFHRRIRSELHNLYGPTEAAVDVSYWPATAGDTSTPVPIGLPVWNTRLVLRDGRMRPVPPGLPGHLYLGGVQLARGYLGRPDLTAERFIPDPDQPGARLYATGDLARLRPDGAVVYLGRSDHQVKIRGLRIELGEIEAAISATGLVREAVVLAREDRAGEKRLVTYLVPAPGYAPGLLAEHLARSLPAYMVPGAEVVLEALPVTVNGKLDRAALPAPSFASEGRDARPGTERLLAGLYADVLGLDRLPSAEGDFFALGGDSLTAVKLALRIGQALGRDPGMGAIFAHPAIHALAAALDAGAVADGTGPVLQLAEGQGAPLFLIHPAGGLSWGYRRLARALAPARPVWGLQHPGLDPEAAMPASLSALAEDYARRIDAVAPAGPLHLAGWSVGGILAQELAVALSAMGRQVGLVALLDAYPADVWRDEPAPDPVQALRALLAIAGHDPEAHRDLDSRQKVVDFLRAGETALGSLPAPVLDGVVRIVTATNGYVRDHHHRRFTGRLVHIRAGADHAGRDLTSDLWQPYAESIEALEVPYLHEQMIGPEAVALIAPMLAARMDA